MKFLSIVLLSFFSGLLASAQIKTTLKKSQAYITERSPGNIPVNPNGGEQPFISYTTVQVYIEATTTKNIKWDTAWYNGKAYAIEVLATFKNDTKAGVLKNTGVPSVVKVKKGNYLVYLNLQPIEITKPAVGKANSINVILTGKYKGIAFSYNAGVPAELEAIPSV